MIDPADDVVVDDPPVPAAAAKEHGHNPAAAAGAGAGAGNAANAAEWENVRRRCRTAEQAVYAALAQYAKVAGQFARMQQSQPPSATTAAAGTGGHAIHIKSERNERQQHGFVTGDTKALQALAAQTERQLDALLSAFAEAVDAMGRFVEGGGASGSATAESTVTRFQSVLYDHQSEFKRTRENISAMTVRDQLLADASRDDVSQASRSNTDLLLREKDSLQTSLNLADEAIASAVGAKGGLDRQRTVLQQIGLRLGTMGAAFPRINALIGRIQRHKQRDSIVLALVIAFCMCFTLFYVWNR